MFELAQSSSLNSLESRIAQWRAEIEDERKEDMGEVAAALMEIGKTHVGAAPAGAVASSSVCCTSVNLTLEFFVGCCSERVTPFA